MEQGTILIVILLCLGAVQGLVYGTIFLKAKDSGPARKWLAILLFFLSYRLIVVSMRLFGLGYYDLWYHLMIDFNWIYGPLIYLFVKAQLIPKFRLQGRAWLHFVPVGVQFICSNFVRTQNFYWDGTRESLSWLGYWGYVIWMNYPTIYMIASLLIIVYSFRAEKLLRSQQAAVTITAEKAGWIRQVLFIFRLYFTVVLAILVVDLLLYDISFQHFYYYFERFYYYPLFIGVAVLTYWLGIAGFNRKEELPPKTPKTISPKEQAQLQELANRLEAYLKVHPFYRDPELTLAALAEQLGVKPYLLSKCLKQHFQLKFNDYINSLRIEELQRLLADPENEKFTLLSLAFEVGFNSKASFNRAVKKLSGQSPKQLRPIRE